MFWLQKAVALLILPPLGPLLLAVIGLLMRRRLPRLGGVLAWVGVLTALALSHPLIVGALVRPLEDAAVLDQQGLRSAQAIVILGGGKRRYAPEYGGQTVSRLTLERVRYGARLARQTGLPVMVTGGALSEGPAEAALMREALERDFDVPVRWTESASRNTRQNALYAAELLKQDGIRRVLLVSHAVHMWRAQAEFAAAGIETIAAPTAFLSGPNSGDHVVSDYVPNAAAAYAGWLATHEWLGNLARRIGVRN